MGKEGGRKGKRGYKTLLVISCGCWVVGGERKRKEGRNLKYTV